MSVQTRSASAALDEARAVLDALEAGRSIAVLTAFEGDHAGARLLVDDERVDGSLGSARLDALAPEAAHAALAAPTHTAETITLDGVRLLLEVHRTLPRLYVVGAGHISMPLARIARIAGFDVTVLDDREEFADATRFENGVDVHRIDLARPFERARPDARAYVVLVTRAHAHDFDLLRELLRAEPLPHYIGMIGSRRRVRAAFGALLDEGVPRDRLARVRAPLGLDIGAQTPEEIAVSVVAEMIAVRRGSAERDDAGAPLATREAVLDRFFPAQAP